VKGMGRLGFCIRTRTAAPWERKLGGLEQWRRGNMSRRRSLACRARPNFAWNFLNGFCKRFDILRTRQNFGAHTHRRGDFGLA
jgi:hypothetical protein